MLYGTTENPDDFVRKRDLFGRDSSESNKNSKQSRSNIHEISYYDHDLSFGMSNTLGGNGNKALKSKGM